MNNVQIIGTGSYAPERVVTNNDLAKIVDTSDEWISTRTGIKERHITEGENTSDLATKASIKALENAGVSPEEIDLIIVGTLTPDAFIPNTACIVQKNIGAVNATCFDISAACTGFIYALDIASQFIKAGRCRTALVIGAETLSKVVDWEDRSTCVIFADGAGAAVVKASDYNGILACYSGSDGTKGHHLTTGAVPVNNPFVKPEDVLPADCVIKMDGREIFKFAVNVITQSIDELLKSSGLNLEDIDYIIPHQANTRIIEFTAKKLGVSQDKFYVNIERFGNTSAGSIAIALDEMNEKGMLKKGDKIILVGFGGGLTYGGMIIKW
ncbi:MAG: beta-ketoacyl-ACP synthase III [Solirubrobacterales bacterium]